MCEELDRELERGTIAAKNLVDHVLAMGGSCGKIPVGGWIVEIRAPKTNQEKEMCKKSTARELRKKDRMKLSIV